MTAHDVAVVIYLIVLLFAVRYQITVWCRIGRKGKITAGNRQSPDKTSLNR